MSTDRETTRLVRSWLEEGVTRLPDLVLDSVLDQVPATPQRRSWWPARRSHLMNAYAKFAIAAAAVVVVAVIGYQLVPSSAVPGGTTVSPSPTVTLAPTTLPSLPAVPAAGPLEPGLYAIYWSGPTISFEVPAGWTGRGRDVYKHSDQAGELGWMAWLPDTARVTHVYSDACHSAGALEPIDGTLQGLVDALDAQVSTDATISDVTIGGRAAKRIDLVASEGLDRADCRHGADGPLQVWADVAETSFYALYPTNSGFVHAMDIDGEIVVFAAATRSDATAADIAELEAIVASVAIGP